MLSYDIITNEKETQMNRRKVNDERFDLTKKKYKTTTLVEFIIPFFALLFFYSFQCSHIYALWSSIMKFLFIFVSVAHNL